MKSSFILLITCFVLVALATNNHHNTKLDGCKICQFVAKMTEYSINKDITNINNLGSLKKACRLFQGPKAQCDAIIDEKGSEIINLIQKKENPISLCQQVELCDKPSDDPLMSLTHLPKTTKLVHYSFCSECKFFVMAIESYIALNSTENEVLGLIEHTCSMAGPFAARCKKIVEIEGPKIFALIIRKEDPQVICEQLELCAQPSFKPMLAVDNSNCPVCEYFINIMESYLASNTTKSEILEFIENYCTLAGPYADQCRAIVKAKGPELFTYIMKMNNPHFLCTQLNFCAQPSVTPMFDFDNSVCPVCEFTIQVIESYIDNNVSEVTILSFIDKICDMILPVTDNCSNRVKINGGLVQWIIKENNPQVICSYLTLCPTH